MPAVGRFQGLKIRTKRTNAPGVQGFSATTDGRLAYDNNLTVPREIREDTMMRAQMVDGGVPMGGYEEVHTMLNVELLGLDG